MSSPARKVRRTSLIRQVKFCCSLVKFCCSLVKFCCSIVKFCGCVCGWGGGGDATSAAHSRVCFDRFSTALVARAALRQGRRVIFCFLVPPTLSPLMFLFARNISSTHSRVRGRLRCTPYIWSHEHLQCPCRSLARYFWWMLKTPSAHTSPLASEREKMPKKSRGKPVKSKRKDEIKSLPRGNRRRWCHVATNSPSFHPTLFHPFPGFPGSELGGDVAWLVPPTAVTGSQAPTRSGPSRAPRLTVRRWLQSLGALWLGTGLGLGSRAEWQGRWL